MSQHSTTEDTIDLKELFFSLLNQWKLIALCIILSLICALLYLRTTPSIYAVDAMVQVEDSKSAASAALLGGLSNLASVAGGQKSPADAEREILNSRLVLGQTIHNLNLDVQIKDSKNTFFQRIITKPKYKLEYSKNGVLFADKKQSFFIEKLEVPYYYLDKPLVLQFTKNQFTLSYKQQVVVQGVLNKNNVIDTPKGQWQLFIQSKQPFERKFTITKFALPTAVKNLVKNYSVAEKGKLTGVLGLTLQGQEPEHITQVLNNILAVYHAQNIERKSLESKQTLDFLDKQLPKLRKQLDDSELKFDKFREQNNTIDVTQESELLLKQSVQLETMRIELKQKQAEYASKYTPDHPLMAEINSQVVVLDKKLSDLNATLKQLPELQRSYIQYYRDVKLNTELYTNLLQNYQHLKISEAGEIGNVRIIDTAVEPIKPIKPRVLIVLVLATLVGGFLGVFIVLARSILHSGIKDSSQIENDLGLPVYATVPRSPTQENRIAILKKKKHIPILAVKHNDDVAIESLRSIRTTIHFALSNAKNNIIMISGPAPEIGKSFISTNLATIFAQGNKRILLIDLDLRRGYLNKYFNRDVKPGLSEFLTEQTSLEQIIHTTEVNNLDFMSRGSSPSNPSELLSSQKFQDTLLQLSQQYDYIILDTPPVLAVTDAIIISQNAGVNLVVARYAKTHLKELELTAKRFEQAGTSISGFILNDIQQSAGGGYSYNYAYAYKATKDD